MAEVDKNNDANGLANEEDEKAELTHNPDTGAKYYRMSEVATHNIVSSLWLVIDNKVYDITNFTLEHPGGEEILFEQGGQDASVPFEDVGHSSDAREMMTKYLIGDVHPLDEVKKEPRGWGAKSTSSTGGGDSSGGRGWFSQMLFGIGLGLVGLAVYKAIL